MTILLLLAACGGTVTITPGQDGCTNYDFDDPAPSVILSSVEGTTGDVRRTGALLEQTGLYFDPAITVDADVVEVHEAWAGGETDESFCYEPWVKIEGIADEVQIRWYLEGEASPMDTVNLTAK